VPKQKRNKGTYWKNLRLLTAFTFMIAAGLTVFGVLGVMTNKKDFFPESTHFSWLEFMNELLMLASCATITHYAWLPLKRHSSTSSGVNSDNSQEDAR
jgi:hypothetical protein